MSTYNVVPGKPSNSSKPNSGGGKGVRAVLIGLGLLLLALLILNPFVVVPAGHRAAIFDLRRGTLQRTLTEGTHFIMPFAQSAILYDVRTQNYTMSATDWEGTVRGNDSLTALTSDGQTVTVDVTVRYRPDESKVHLLHQSVGQDYVNKLIRPRASEQARVVIAQFPVSDVYGARRAQIEDTIETNLRKSLEGNNIKLDDVLLRDVQFSPAFAAQIEQKLIAQQNDQRKGYELQRELKVKQQRILEAQGEAASITLRGRAIAQNSRVVQYEYARKLAPNVGAIITDGRGVNVPFAAQPNRPAR